MTTARTANAARPNSGGLVSSLLGFGNAKKAIESAFAEVDVRFDGGRAHDITVHNDALFQRFLRSGRLGMGEAYMDGWWDCADLDELYFRMLRHDLRSILNAHKKDFRFVFDAIKAKLAPAGSLGRSHQIAHKHYNWGDELFEAFLDSRMQYTCGYWHESTTLEEAQVAKLDLICRKLGLKKGMTLLDIGCGWGGLAKYAAKKYGAQVVGVTVSENQATYARKLCEGLAVEIRLQDYRKLEGIFDRITVVGMIEHVGRAYYRDLFDKAASVLKDDGLFLLHTIGASNSDWAEPFATKYIFPGGYLPSLAQLTTAMEDLFVVEDVQNFGHDYSRTLLAWNENFVKNYPKIKNDYDQRFYRMWTFFLQRASGAFRARHQHLWQLVLSKQGVLGNYKARR